MTKSLLLLPLLLVLTACDGEGPASDDNPAVEETDAMDADNDGFSSADDCDDSDAAINPDANETPYDGLDNDCDPSTLDDDLDEDGYVLADDCDDTNGLMNPGLSETPFDSFDNDCDPSTSDDDGDQDGFDVVDDCDDADPLINPAAAEAVYDGLDNDCDPSTLDDDLDEDGYVLADDCDDTNGLMNPGLSETPFDSFDNDCDPSTSDDDGDQDGFDVADDCDDADPELNESDADNDGVSTCMGDLDDDDPSIQEDYLAGYLFEEQDLGFRYIPSGTFTMGCVLGRDNTPVFSCSEYSPSHQVTLTRGFLLMEAEVTQVEFETVAGYDPSLNVGRNVSCADCPVERVSWHEAAWFANEVSFSEGLPACYTCTGTPALGSSHGTTCTAPTDVYACTGYRLPTEAEWEYAARGGQDHQFSGSDTVGDVAWYGGNSSPTGSAWNVDGQTRIVCTKDSNAWGLCDMSGNVWEWTNDWYAESYYTPAAITDPQGPNPVSWLGWLARRVARGGSWENSAGNLQVAVRGARDPRLPDVFFPVGFRLARTVP